MGQGLFRMWECHPVAFRVRTEIQFLLSTFKKKSRKCHLKTFDTIRSWEKIPGLGQG